MAQKQERSRETEAAIMRAAMKLSLLKETEEVTVREICAEAGVSTGAFYHHFASRQELFHRVFESFDRELHQRMTRRSQQKPPLDVLTDLLMFQVSFVSQEASTALPYYYRAMLSDPSRAAVNPDRAYYRAAYDCVQRLAEEGQLRPECHPHKIAELCISFVRGCLIDWCLHNQSYDIVEHVRNVLPILFRGFLQK